MFFQLIENKNISLNAFSTSLLKNQNNKEKREAITEIISNLINTDVPFSVRSIAKILSVSRKLVTQVITKIITMIFYPSYWYLSDLKNETRGRKKIEEKHPEIVNQIKVICKNSEHVDKSLQDRIIYIDITLSGIKEKLIEEYNYSKEE